MDKKKVIFVILTILLILGGVGAGVYLVQQSAEYREKQLLLERLPMMEPALHGAGNLRGEAGTTQPGMIVF